jgi:hypothetical protein
MCEAQSMASFAWETIPVFASVFGGALLCLPLTRCFPFKYLLATSIYLFADVEVLVHAPRLETLHWNWIGKFLSLFLAFIAAWLFRIAPKELGLVRVWGKDWLWLIVGCVTAAFVQGAINYVHSGHNPLDLETLLFEATLPGMAEELAYRGVAFALLCRGYRNGPRNRSNIAVVFISAFAFGSIHSLSHNQAGWQFAGVWATLPFLLGLWCGILRWRTSNVVVPVLVHNVGNCAAFWAASL